MPKFQKLTYIIWKDATEYNFRTKPKKMVHIDLIVPYYKSIIQKQSGGAVILKELSLTCMMMINIIKSLFETIQAT